MRRRHLFWVLCVAMSLMGCAHFSRKEARTVLDIAEMTCALAHAEMFDMRTVADACNIADELFPALDSLLESRRRAAIQRARMTGACP